ncbi:TULIP family P47-like protein [Bacillus cereus group sp. Bc222]|uniref:TULIP family P47-like protein n=1 Tax=Bacillus cereus group sp. Bc222 TaxID=3018111 RepID=UPI0022E7A330|nr:TULIP family P47-like protein [Bacillus cereus group sp. Bc222]MDA2241745.1 TULIP family P47-like protein [Bacillus cereus group sp. Bc222]
MTISHSTTTLNWDTVFAIPITEVNRIITEQKSSPKKFELHDSDRHNFKGEFKEWQITPGGDGNSIRMKIPVFKFTTYLKGDFLFPKGDYGFQSADLYIQVKLNYIPQEKSTKNTANEALYDLKMKTDSSDPIDPTVIAISLKNVEGMFYPETFHNTFSDDEMFLKEKFKSQIIRWLQLNLDKFNHTFNVVNLNHHISKDEPWAWCKPSYVDYAYTDIEGNLNKSLLGVLCMTGGREGGIQQQQKLDAHVIPMGSNAGFLIAQERYLENVLLRTLLMKFKNSKIDDYEIINNSGEAGQYQYILQLKDNKTIQLEKVNGDGAEYIPFLKKLKISLVGDEMRMESYTETPISATGVTAWCETIHHYRIILAKNKKGEQTISYEKTNDPTIRRGTDKDGSGIIDIAKILLLIGGTILSIMTSGATSFIVGVVVSILYGILDNLPQLIEMYNVETSPSIDLMLKSTTSQIIWNASKTFKLDYAGLAGPLQLGGKFMI